MNNLQVCDWHHPGIAYTTKYCPLCEAKAKIDELEVEINILEEKLENNE